MSWMRDAVAGFKKYNEKKAAEKKFNPIWGLYAVIGLIVILSVMDAILH